MTAAVSAGPGSTVITTSEPVMTSPTDRATGIPPAAAESDLRRSMSKARTSCGPASAVVTGAPIAPTPTTPILT